MPQPRKHWQQAAYADLSNSSSLWRMRHHAPFLKADRKPQPLPSACMNAHLLNTHRYQAN
jgi:hypothetical protein